MYETAELPTREQLLHLLKMRGPLSAKDITLEMQITDMAVRRHLGTLERDGYVDFALTRQNIGRPTAVYRLTELAEGFFPKTYHTLTLELLDELTHESGEEMINLLFNRRKQKMLHKYEADITVVSLHERVTQLTAVQNDHGYMAESTLISNGEFILTEHNCPISQIACQYNHACQCELELFRSVLQADVSRSECLAEGGSKCVYHITTAAAHKS